MPHHHRRRRRSYGYTVESDPVLGIAAAILAVLCIIGYVLLECGYFPSVRNRQIQTAVSNYEYAVMFLLALAAVHVYYYFFPVDG